MIETETQHNPILIGHDEAMRQVAEAFAGGRMHHAWLITGIEGVGKATLAHHIAHHILSNGQNPIGQLDLNQRVAKLVSAGTHPDFHTVARARDEKSGELRNVIVVEDALKIAAFLRKTSTHGGWRVVIVDEAHMMNRNGENAILKVLEEPPARTVIIMTVTTTGALLPTIRSRCRVLALAPLGHDTMKTILARCTPHLSLGEIERLIRLSGGSIGFALKLVRSEAMPLYDEMLEILKGRAPIDVQRVHKLADQISRKADAQSFDVLATLLHDYIRNQVQGAALNGDKAMVDRHLQEWDHVSQTFSMVDSASLDRKLAFINAVVALRVA